MLHVMHTYIHTHSGQCETPKPLRLAHVLRLLHLASHRPQIAVQRASEQLQQHLETDAGESWVVAAPTVLSVCDTFESYVHVWS